MDSLTLLVVELSGNLGVSTLADPQLYSMIGKD